MRRDPWADNTYQSGWWRAAWPLLKKHQSSSPFALTPSSANHDIKYTWKPTFIKGTSLANTCSSVGVLNKSQHNDIPTHFHLFRSVTLFTFKHQLSTIKTTKNALTAHFINVSRTYLYYSKYLTSCLSVCYVFICWHQVCCRDLNSLQAWRLRRPLQRCSHVSYVWVTNEISVKHRPDFNEARLTICFFFPPPLKLSICDITFILHWVRFLLLPSWNLQYIKNV